MIQNVRFFFFGMKLQKITTCVNITFKIQISVLKSLIMYFDLFRWWKIALNNLIQNHINIYKKFNASVLKILYSQHFVPN